MKLKKDFKLRQVCGENIVTAEGLKAIDFSKLMSLNETAAFLWNVAEKQGDFTAGSLAEALCEEFDVEKTQAEADCRTVMEAWAKEGLAE